MAVEKRRLLYEFYILSTKNSPARSEELVEEIGVSVRTFKSDIEDLKQFAIARKKCSFQQLYTSDNTNHVWDSTISHYSQLYGINPKGMCKYSMPEDDKLLFEEIKRHYR